MHVVIFCHSLISDWNNGHAHFLRGIVSELRARGHRVTVYEPRDAWSVSGLTAECGETAVQSNAARLGDVRPIRYEPASLALDEALDGVDLVLVHEWNEPHLVARIGAARRGAGFRLLFHDTHHRAATAPEEMARYDLREYDGVLAFGSVIRDRYLAHGWANRVWTWHEAADVRRFRPQPRERLAGDVVWIGNWGDDERTLELVRYLIVPIVRLRLRATAYGVRYPALARALLADAGIAHGGWLSNLDVPAVFSAFDLTIHVPRRAYVEKLPGIPTIRVFEALACGMPLICAPWDDADGLFTAGEDYLTARDGRHMEQRMRDVLHDAGLAAALAARGVATIMARHTCAHRVDELLAIHAALGGVMTEPVAV